MALRVRIARTLTCLVQISDTYRSLGEMRHVQIGPSDRDRARREPGSRRMRQRKLARVDLFARHDKPTPCGSQSERGDSGRESERIGPSGRESEWIRSGSRGEPDSGTGRAVDQPGHRRGSYGFARDPRLRSWIQAGDARSAAAGHYTVTFVNDGQAPHDLTFSNGAKIVAGGGETIVGEVDVPAEGLAFICSVPGHKDRDDRPAHRGRRDGGGIAGRQPAAECARREDHRGPGPAHVVAADPNAPAPVVRDPAAPELMTGEVHDITLVASERTMTVAKGYVQAVWTFGDSVPGPFLRVKVGDTVRLTLRTRRRTSWRTRSTSTAAWSPGTTR